MNDLMARITIPRSDPEGSSEPRLAIYEVPYAEGMRVAQALRYIFENIDGSLAFRNSFCKRGSCGICMVMVDKKPVMACKEVVRPEMLVEPLADRALIKDLAVDFDRDQTHRAHESGLGSSKTR